MSRKGSSAPLVLGLVAVLFLGAAFWWLNNNYHIFSRGNRNCSGQADIYIQNNLPEDTECGMVGKGVTGDNRYLGIFREVKKIRGKYFMAVDFVNKTNWYYLGEGNKDGMVYVGFANKYQQALNNVSVPQNVKFGLDEQGIRNINQYKGSFMGFSVFPSDQLQEGLKIPYTEIESGISREQYEVFRNYIEKCNETNNGFFANWLSFCTPYATGIEIYE